MKIQRRKKPKIKRQKKKGKRNAALTVTLLSIDIDILLTYQAPHIKAMVLNYYNNNVNLRQNGLFLYPRRRHMLQGN